MVNFLSKAAIVGVVFVSILYQFVFKTIIFDTLGYGRSIEVLADFPNARCEKVEGLGLEGCEDMWLHQSTGYLYMACSDSQSRTQWLPAIDFLNAAGRGVMDRIAILDTRAPGPVASRLKWITPENFPGNNGDGTLNLHGFDVLVDKNTDTLRILLINHRPPFDPVTGTPLDAAQVGANSTIELFQTKAGSDTMRYIRTYANDVIITPNRVQWVSDHSFVFTNDHSGKVGARRHLEPFLGGGTVGYCDRHRCNFAKTFGANFVVPNGLARSSDGLIYVPSSFSGEIRVFTLNEHHTLDQVDSIQLPLPIDNLSFDKDGDLYVACLTQLHTFSKSTHKPFDVKVPGTVFRVRRVGASKGGNAKRGKVYNHDEGYVINKVLEDDGTTISGVTVAVHDTESGRVFMGGAVTPFITICEMK